MVEGAGERDACCRCSVGRVYIGVLLAVGAVSGRDRGWGFVYEFYSQCNVQLAESLCLNDESRYRLESVSRLATFS